MSASRGRSASVVLVGNDLARGRALGRACVAAGLAAPAWVVTSGVPGRPILSFDVTIVIPEDGAFQIGQFVESGPGGRVIVVGERPAPDALEWIAPEAGWELRVVDRLIDYLGHTPALLPTYENRLRVLGRELDRRGYPAVSIRELPEGFRVQPEPPGDDRLPALNFTDREFGRLAREIWLARGEDEEFWERPTGRSAPDGWERTLRAIGWDLDGTGASGVQVVTLARGLLVSGLRAASPYDAAEPFQSLFREEHLRDLERRTASSRREPEDWLGRLRNKLGMDS